MNANIDFIFRKKLYKAELFFDDSEYPCFVFVIIHDKALIEEFGDEITLKTDLQKLLPKKDDYPELVGLREAIFSIAKNTAVFLAGKEKWQKHISKETVKRV
jgi:hypothetical protein